MPVRRISSAEAFATIKANPNSDWPRREDPANRFSHLADPQFEPRFRLEPGQRIFTIGSCFARGIETALAARGFDIPTLGLEIDKERWRGDPAAILNNYVPPAIAPQIRWAFGHEPFDIARHGAEVVPGRHIDLQLTLGFRPEPPDVLIRRREEISRIYRTLADSQVVLITLGLIEAWFDNRSGLYINCTPTRGITRADPTRFELHVLDYDDVARSLGELIALLGQVCPRDYRLILTVSPVPLTATFTRSDVAVANSYSKAVLRAAIEPLVAAHDHIDYFPSYESVVLTDRSIAYLDDQIHIDGALVRFNVDRMIGRYVASAAESTASVLERARAERKAGRFGVGLKILQSAWTAKPDDAALTVALAEAQIRAGSGATAERLLVGHLEGHENVAARNLLARYYNDTGRHEEAALQAEKASEVSKVRLQSSLQRVVAYYHLGRYEEGLALLGKISHPLEQKPLIVYWKGRYCARLGRAGEAEEHFRTCNSLSENVSFMVGFAEFLAEQQRWPEAMALVDAVLLRAPYDRGALALRVAGRKHRVPGTGPGIGPAAAIATGKAAGLFRQAASALGAAVPFGRRKAAQQRPPGS